MEIYLIVRRKKITLFLQAFENTPVFEVKKKIEGILKVSTENQQLYYKNKIMDETKTFLDCGINGDTAMTYSPANIDLAIKIKDGNFEQLEIAAYSVPKKKIQKQ